MRANPRLRSVLAVLATFVLLTAAVAANARDVTPDKPSRGEVESLTRSAAGESERKPIEARPSSLTDVYNAVVDGWYLVEIAEGTNDLGEERVYILLLVPDPEIKGEWLPYSAVDVSRDGTPITEVLTLPSGRTYLAYVDASDTTIRGLDADGNVVRTIRPSDTAGLVEIDGVTDVEVDSHIEGSDSR